MTTTDDLIARLDRLETANRELTARLEAVEGRPAPLAGREPAPGHPMGRRAAMRKGLGLAGAAAVGAVLLDAAPAAAANGNAIVIGAANTGTNTTTLGITGSGQGHGVELLDNNTPFGGATFRSTLAVRAVESRFSTAINVKSSSLGIDVSSSGQGLKLSTGSLGIDVLSDSDGMQIVSDDKSIVAISEAGAQAIYASTNASSGVGVEGNGKAAGVRATSSAVGGLGLDARAASGNGLKAVGGNWGVIAQSFTTDPDLGALGASAVDGMAIYASTDNGQVLRGRSSAGGGIDVSAPQYHLRLSNTATRGAPTGDRTAHQRGDVVETSTGDLWLCTTAGTPGTWRKLAGPATAGAFHVLPRPVRAYDSRPGGVPTSVGPKTPLAAGNVARTLDLKAGGTGVPAGATAVMVSVLLTNARSGNGNFTIWANGVAKPQSNTLVWGGSAGRFGTLAVTAVDGQARCQVDASLSTHVVVDVVGYYR